MSLKQMKIPDQAHICLRKYRLYAQNMLIICLFDEANGCQTQRLCFFLSIWNLKTSLVNKTFKMVCSVLKAH